MYSAGTLASAIHQVFQGQCYSAQQSIGYLNCDHTQRNHHRAYRSHRGVLDRLSINGSYCVQNDGLR